MFVKSLDPPIYVSITIITEIQYLKHIHNFKHLGYFFYFFLITWFQIYQLKIVHVWSEKGTKTSQKVAPDPMFLLYLI